MSQALALAWLTALWVVLWRELTLANVVVGAVVAAVVVTAAPARWEPGGAHRVRLLPLARFVAYFLWKLLEANVVLAREVVTRRDDLQRGIVAVQISEASELVSTIVANAITLTPGTLTLDIRSDPRTLYVHVLHLRDVESVRRDVLQFEQLAMKAFPRRSPEAGAPA